MPATTDYGRRGAFGPSIGVRYLDIGNTDAWLVTLGFGLSTHD